MNQHVRDVLREAGAEAGRQARADAGLPEHVEDHQAVQYLAELLITVELHRRPVTGSRKFPGTGRAPLGRGQASALRKSR